MALLEAVKAIAKGQSYGTLGEAEPKPVTPEVCDTWWVCSHLARPLASPSELYPAGRLVAVPTGNFLCKAQIARTFCVGSPRQWQSNLRATELSQYHKPLPWVCLQSSRGVAGDCVGVSAQPTKAALQMTARGPRKIQILPNMERKQPRQI